MERSHSTPGPAGRFLPTREDAVACGGNAVGVSAGWSMEEERERGGQPLSLTSHDTQPEASCLAQGWSSVSLCDRAAAGRQNPGIARQAPGSCNQVNR